MAIQVRRGLHINLDQNKAVAGEFLLSTDKQVIHICFAPGVVKRLSTYEDMKADMQESLQGIIDNLTLEINHATDNANSKAELAEQKAMLADAKAIFADQKAQQAQAVIDSVAPIINKNLQATYTDKTTSLSSTFITCTTSDDGLAEITNITDVGVGFTLISSNEDGTKTDSLVITYPYPTLPIYIKSYKGTTTITTNATIKPTLTADFKSELWSRDYLQDEQLKSKFDVNSQIDFIEAANDVDIVTKDNTPTLWGKTLKRFNTIKLNLSNLSSNIGTIANLLTTDKTSLVSAINELVNGKFDKNNIVQTDTVGGNDKVSSAEVTKALGLEVDTLNNNLVNGFAKYEPIANGNLNIGEAGLDSLITQGNYSVYFTETGSHFTSGTVWLLEVRRVYYKLSGVGYVQRLTNIYPTAATTKTRTYYSATGWGSWI